MSLGCLVCSYFRSGYLSFTHPEDWASEVTPGIIRSRVLLLVKPNSASSPRDGKGGFDFQKKKKENWRPEGARSEKPEGRKD